MKKKLETLTAGWVLLNAFILLPGIAGGVERGSITLKNGVIYSAILLASMWALLLIKEACRG